MGVSYPWGSPLLGFSTSGTVNRRGGFRAPLGVSGLFYKERREKELQWAQEGWEFPRLYCELLLGLEILGC